MKCPACRADWNPHWKKCQRCGFTPPEDKAGKAIIGILADIHTRMGVRKK